MSDVILHQINPTIGDFKNNYERILTRLHKAPEESLLILSGMPLSGINLGDPMMSEYQEEYNSLPVPHLIETWWTQESDKTIPYRMYGLDTPQR